MKEERRICDNCKNPLDPLSYEMDIVEGQTEIELHFQNLENLFFRVQLVEFKTIVEEIDGVKQKPKPVHVPVKFDICANCFILAADMRVSQLKPEQEAKS